MSYVKGNPIVLNKIEVNNNSGAGINAWQSVVTDNSVSATTAPVTGRIEASSWKKVTKTDYNKVTNNAVIKTTTSAWQAQSGTTSLKQTMWKTKSFKKKTGTGSSTKYYTKTIKYFSQYRTTQGVVTYNFAVQPISLSLTYQDLDIEDENVGTDVGRDKSNGLIVRHRVRKNVRTLECEFPPMDHATVQAMMPFLNAEYNSDGFLTLYYTDAYKGTNHKMICYAGDRSMEAGQFGLWLNFKVTFVEQ